MKKNKIIISCIATIILACGCLSYAVAQTPPYIFEDGTEVASRGIIEIGDVKFDSTDLGNIYAEVSNGKNSIETSITNAGLELPVKVGDTYTFAELSEGVDPWDDLQAGLGYYSKDSEGNYTKGDAKRTTLYDSVNSIESLDKAIADDNISYVEEHRDEIVADLSPEEMATVESSYLTSHALGNTITSGTTGTSYNVESGKYYFYLVCGFCSSSITVGGGTITETCHQVNYNNYAYTQYTGIVHAEFDTLTFTTNMAHSAQYVWLYELNENHLPTVWRSNNSGGNIEVQDGCKYLVFMGGTNVTSYMLTNAKNLQSQYYWTPGGGGGYIPYRYQAIATANGSTLNLSACHFCSLYKLN